MRKPSLLVVSAVILAVFLSVSGCMQRKPPAAPAPENIVLGVAGFTQPQYSWELLAGYLPETRTMAKESTLIDLDRMLFDKLDKTKNRQILGPAITRQCQEIVVFEKMGSREAALKYWTRVGRCLPADYLLVPQLVNWQEREGNSMGVTTPAGIILDLFLVDVKKQELVNRFRFDETQTSLAENFLDADKFFRRGGKWVTAHELADEGLSQSVRELGL